MSKRNSSATSNTLFNYFTKTPPSNKKPKVDNERQEKNNTNEKNKKRERELTESPEYKPLSDHESDDEEEIPKVSKKKRIRLYPVDSDESDSENRADNQVKIAISKKSLDSFKASPRSSREEETTVPATSTKKLPSTPKSKPVEEDTAVSGDGNWLHLKLDFLKPEHIRDKMKRRPEHPDYDSRTLFVPDDFMKEQTPAHRQWWDMKSSHYDCVLFFKVGKFYELYHMDAAVGVNELGFSYMKGEFAHSGFPESAYARMASSLVAKGYKVARVEQTETPDMMQERCRKTGKSTKWDKVVQREICQVTCQGTEVCGLQDFGPRADQPAYMMAIVEERSNNSYSTYGICMVDTSTGSIHLGQFTDDIHSSRLMTTLAHYPPALIIYERRTTSPKTLHIINSQSGKLRKECINQLWSAERTLKFLADRYYMTGDGENRWPDGLKKFISQGDVLGLTPAQDSELIIKALGGCVSYLKDCLLDIQVLTMSQFHSYTPVNCRDISQHVGDQWNGPEHMILDAITLRNLRIVGESGSLYDRLNFCCTAMGKRLLHQWLCTPCCDIVRIRERQAAVRHLMENNEVCEQVRTILKQLPDLERLLAKLHALGNLRRSKDHPDGRAIFYEEKTYTKRNVKDFISVVNGFESILCMVKMFDDCQSVLLRRLTQVAPDGKFPDYSKNLEFFKGAFDPVEAEREGRILPRPGVDTEYDECLEQIAEIEGKLEDYRREQEKYFKCKIQYVGTDKKRYQLEIPESASKKADEDYQLEGSRKGFKRFSTFETKELLGDMQAAEQSRVNILLDLSRRMMERFTSTFSVWDQAVRTVAHMDVLCSLAEYGRLLSLSCFPEVVSPDDKGVFLDITDGCHPCIPVADEFIPNDTRLGVDVPTFVLLSGPNMGGKSTLMRQVGLITVMAHIGSPVPAESCSMSLCSRVFTRVGARDDLISGQSTFLVEMSEAATILTHADHHSLVLIDELGRGTSTYDGTAIAWSVMLSLSKLKCRTIFSTHYHRLSQKAVHLNNIRLMHMGCMVETEEKQSGEVSEEMITFLYKLSNGACPKSYGFNAARLAGLSANVITRAQGLAMELQQRAENLRALRDIMKSDKIEELRAIVKNITV